MLSRIALKNSAVRTFTVPLRQTQTSSSNNNAAAAVQVQEGPERDLVNFPRPVRLINPGKVRMGFIPEEWFNFFYNKTGVTGPYTFGVGLVTFLCSKEVYVMEHEFYTGLSFGLMMVYAVKKFGPGVAAWLDKEVEKQDADMNEGRVSSIANTKAAIESEKVGQDSAAASLMLFDAKKENVALQLEAAYRANLMQVYTETKKRLDYQVECQAVQRNMEQKNIVDWVIRNVRQAVTAEQEKAALSQCIASIKNLAKSNTARI